MFGMMIDTGPKFYTVPSPPPYMTLVKVTDRTSMLKFYVKVLGPYCFQTLWYICFMFDIMIDAGPKFYVVQSPTPYMTLRSRSWT